MERTQKLLIAFIVILFLNWLTALYCWVKSHDENVQLFIEKTCWKQLLKLNNEEQKARIAELKEENQRIRDEIEAIDGGV